MSPRTAEEQQAITPPQALTMLRDGNARFLASGIAYDHHLADIRATAEGQFPFAAIVGCADSRIPPEMIFDQEIGDDLFVARVAGNFVNDDILGSLEFATKLAGARLIVILGHTSCGAVLGAVDGVQLGLLTGALARINPAVASLRPRFRPADSSNSDFVDAVAELNVRLTMEELEARSLVYRRMLDDGPIGMAGAMYDVATGTVTFLD